MDPKDSDRAQILRRRAFFVSSALTALGCNNSGRPPEGQPSSATEPPAPPTPTVSAAVDPTATAAATAAPVEPPPPAEGPDLSTPDGVGEVAAENYKRLRDAVAAIRKRIDELGASLPDACKITDQACDLQWRKLAEGLLDIAKSIRRLPPRCGGSSEEAKAFFKQRDAAREDLQKRVGALGRRISALVATQAEQERWADHQQDAEQANPEPCLKFACTDW